MDEYSTVDLPGAKAVLASDPVRFERWILTKLGGIGADHLDEGIDGEIWCPGSITSDTDRFLVVVKGGDQHDARTVADLVAAVQEHDVAGGVLVFMTDPPPEVYEAAQRLGASPRDHGQDGVPLVQVLTIPELLNGRKPVGLDDGEP